MCANDETREAFHLKTGRRVAREIDEDVEPRALVHGSCSAVFRRVHFSYFLFLYFIICYKCTTEHGRQQPSSLQFLLFVTFIPGCCHFICSSGLSLSRSCDHVVSGFWLLVIVSVFGQFLMLYVANARLKGTVRRKLKEEEEEAINGRGTSRRENEKKPLTSCYLSPLNASARNS